MKKLLSTFVLSFLLISCSKEDEAPIQNVNVPVDNSTIKTFKDVVFALQKNSTSLPNYFSTSTGKSLKKSEITSENVASVDIAFVSLAGALNYFASPNDSSQNFGITGATKTDFVNFVKPEVFNPEMFDKMIDDNTLKNLVIVNDNDAFSISKLPVVILFKNAANKKGVISLKSINSERIIADIKVQK